jgi:hypothetical protein
MLRRVHRTLIAKFCAACLLAFALSPVSAPFTTCDVPDVAPQVASGSGHAPDGRRHPDTGRHPGRQMATLRVRVAAHVVTAAAALPTVQHVAWRDLGPTAPCALAATCVRADLRTVLRL